MVYVLDMNGNPLMPSTRYGRVRHLLKDGKAKIVRREPFTIKLLYESTTYTQDITLGVDTGSGTFGAAAVNDKNEVIYMSEVQVRNDIKETMDDRRTFRRNRRSRKTRYRAPRFLNRKNSKRKDRFSPTMTSKVHSHEKEIEFIKSILPVTRTVLENGHFDPHLMKNPALANPKLKPWGYQHGPNYGYANRREAVLARDNFTCQCCKGKHKDPALEVHHIVYRSMGGSDDMENLITLCSTCHKDLHDGKIHPRLKGKAKGTLKYATQMNSIRVQLLKRYPDAIETFGYVTKENRFRLGLGKGHCIDACVIASGGEPITFKTMDVYKKKCIASRSIKRHKGKRSEIPITIGKINGFKRYDKVLYLGKSYFINGNMSSGYAALMHINGKPADFSYMPRGSKTPKHELMKRTGARKSWMVTTEHLTTSIA